MSKEFQPYHTEEKKSEFNAWEYQLSQENSETLVDEVDERNKEYERLREEAIKKGYAEGILQAEKEIDTQKAKLAQWIDILQRPVQLLDKQLVQEMIQTIIWLCQYCIGIELSVNPDKLHALLDEIKEELPALKGDKTLALHPDDVTWINATISEKEIPGLLQILIADPSLNRGDFYLKSENSELDGGIHTRLIALFAQHIDQDNLSAPNKPRD